VLPVSLAGTSQAVASTWHPTALQLAGRGLLEGTSIWREPVALIVQGELNASHRLPLGNVPTGWFCSIRSPA
jgi:hypothetical protein